MRLPLPVEEVLIVMIRSIYGQWKFRYAFCYTHRKLTAEYFATIFRDTITVLLEIGLKVRPIVADGLAKNKTAMQIADAWCN